MSCAVYGCSNNSTNADPSVSYYYFPKQPSILQQWISACWRPDPIDVVTAQVCSNHFDDSSYTSSYKMDYLGNYTKILKVDAIPTLYLPNPQPIIINAHSETNFGSTSVDVKDIVVYQVEALPVANNFVVLNDDDDNKYKHITTRQQLEHVIKQNELLKQSCDASRTSLNELQSKVQNERDTIKRLDEEINKLTKCNDTMQRASMSLTQQKSVLSKVFSESQIKILSGKKKIYWSNDDMAVGYTIRHLSNKRCYMYLSKNLNVPLPALSSIKRWSTLKKHEFNKEKSGSKFEDEDSE